MAQNFVSCVVSASIFSVILFRDKSAFMLAATTSSDQLTMALTGGAQLALALAGCVAIYAVVTKPGAPSSPSRKERWFTQSGTEDARDHRTLAVPVEQAAAAVAVDEWLDPHSKIHRGSNATPFALDNSFEDADASTIKVRGKNYLCDRIKVPSRPPLFGSIGIHNFMRGEGAVPLPHVASAVPSLRNHIEARPGSFFLIVSWLIPGPPFRTVVFAFERILPVGSDPVVDRLFQDFLDGTDDQRRKRFKYIPRLDVAPSMVLSGVRMLGGEVPTLLCNKLTAEYFRGKNYIEVSIDIASSRAANMVAGLILPKITVVCVTHTFLLEGHSASELPERVLGTITAGRIQMIANTVKI